MPDQILFSVITSQNLHNIASMTKSGEVESKIKFLDFDNEIFAAT